MQIGVTVRLKYTLFLTLLILSYNPVCAETNANDFGQFAYDSLVLAINNLSSDELINLPSATKSLILSASFLALKIMENERGPTANQLLAKAVALRLDAALAEEHTCAVLRRRSGMLAAMKNYRANLKDEIQSCAKDACRLQVHPSSVCTDATLIMRRADDIIKALEKGRRCD
jgi:hypothetical protein